MFLKIKIPCLEESICQEFKNLEYFFPLNENSLNKYCLSSKTLLVYQYDFVQWILGKRNIHSLNENLNFYLSEMIELLLLLTFLNHF